MRAGGIQKWSYVATYVILWAAQALMVKASKVNGHYPYNLFSVTLSVELVKLVLAYAYYRYLKQTNPADYTESLSSKWVIAKYFAIPSVIYLIYNILAMMNLRLLEPATYRLLINAKIITSGLMFQYFFNKILGVKQWVGLVLLVIGCAVEQVGSFVIDGGLLALILMGIQATASSAGGVYFQWLLQKEDAQHVTLWEKNIFLYSWGAMFNFFFIVVGQPQLLSPSQFFAGYSHSTTQMVILLGALGGFSTSLLLQNLDVVAKEYANFLEMIVIAVFARFIFGTALNPHLLVGIVIVACSVVLFNRGEQEVAELERRQIGFTRIASAVPEDTGGAGRQAEADAQRASRSYDEFVLSRSIERDEEAERSLAAKQSGGSIQIVTRQ